MTWRRATPNHVRLFSLLAVIGLISTVSFTYLHALVTVLGPRSITLSTANPNEVSNYTLSFTTRNDDTLGSIDAQFCTNDPLLNTPCTQPSGLDFSDAVLANQTGATGFTISPASTSSNIILTRAASTATAGVSSYNFTNVVNPNAVGSYYIRLQTYASTDATGTANEGGGLAFSINAALSVEAEVPPYLEFCAGVTIVGQDCTNVSGDYVDFGELGPSVTRQATTQLLAASNAANGYVIQVDGSTLTSGNSVIAGLDNDVSRRGVNQFGLNLVANTTPSVGARVIGSGTVTPLYAQANFFRFLSGDTVAQTLGPTAPGTYTVSYITNVESGQPAGVYVSTLTYVCLANF